MKKDSCVIYLADLVHNYASKGPHTFPLNIGYVAAYAKKLYSDKIQFKLFKFPLDLINAIKQQKPDIIGLGNYTWNLDINNKIAGWVKSLSKDIITVCGGPDYPITPEECLNYLKQRPNLDFYVIYQGEKGFANILERYFQSSSLEGMKQAAIENCSFYNKGMLIVSDRYRYPDNLDEIPSPYLTGIMDEFFKTNLIPILETNRGCPYSCTYCAWGNSSRGKVMPFSLGRVKDEIGYIAKRVKNTTLLICADANFGILKRDIEIAEYIKQASEQYSYPRHMSAGWEKTAPDRVIKMAQLLSGIAGVTISYQTMDPSVMANVKRTNLSLESFKKIQDYFNKKNLSTCTELILGLPGETRDMHLKGLRQLFDYNTHAIECYNLRMIGGSELSLDDSRKRFNIQTKYRLIDGGFGKYNGIVSIEHEEMVLSTATMTEEDILYFRPIHFLIQFLWNHDYYRELLYFLKNEGVNLLDFIITVLDKKDSAPKPVKAIFGDFKKEAYNEWFDTKYALFDYYTREENFKKISEGAFGKLNFKYTYRVLLECKGSFDDYLFALAESILSERGMLNDSRKVQLDDLLKYTKGIFVNLANVPKGFSEKKAVRFKYDILEWKKQAYKRPLSAYGTDGLELRFTLSQEQAVNLKKLYRQFETADINQTLRKMVEQVTDKSAFFCAVDYVSNTRDKKDEQFKISYFE